LQKFPAEKFKATTKISFHPNVNNEKIGMIIMGMDYAYISLTKKQDGIYVSYAVCTNAIKENKEQEQVIAKLNGNSVFFTVEVKDGAVCTFSYSEDNKNFIPIDGSFSAKAGRWIGAKLGYFCSRMDQTNDSGYADIDWFRISAIENK
jgi:Beta xylosidase C-terminal Concanavalin A-like domain